MSLYNIKYLCLFLSSSARTLNLIVLWQISQSSMKNFEWISLKVKMFKIEIFPLAMLAIKVYVGKSKLNSAKKLPALGIETRDLLCPKLMSC